MAKALKDKLTLDIPELVTFEEEQEKSPTPHTTSRKNKTTYDVDLNVLLKFIKPYDGSRETLNAFMVNCSNAIELASDIQKPILFKYILSQLQGKAETACSIKEFSTWGQLKEFLITQFSQRKHYAFLLTELQECKQNIHESVNQFALRIETCLSQLLTEISMNPSKVKEVPGRVAAMEDLALHHFTMGLNPRISNIIRCRNPKTLNEAVNFAITEERILQNIYKKNEPNRPNLRPNIQNRNPNINDMFQRLRVSQFQRPNFPGQMQRPAIINQMQRLVPNQFYRPAINNQPQRPAITGPPQRAQLICKYCKLPGHDINNCYKKRREQSQFKARINYANDGYYENEERDETDFIYEAEAEAETEAEAEAYTVDNDNNLN